MEKKNNYFLGLDIGTNSVGYAVTNPDYTLKKFRGEPMWGCMLFDKAEGSAKRRMHRTARRRLDRRQERVALLEEIFAPEIVKIDENFFIRRRESALFKEDSTYGVKLFEGGVLTDKEYHKNYPTIHHLIKELMESDEEHDIRLIFIACAWLVANRGHFLFEIPNDQIGELLSFDRVYNALHDYLTDNGYCLPWSLDMKTDNILSIISDECGVRKKLDRFKNEIFGGKKPSKKPSESFPYSVEATLTLLSGGRAKPKDIFDDQDYSEIEALSLVMQDEDFERIIAELGEDGEFLIRLRDLVNCAKLIAVMKGESSVSAGKVAIYEQHKKDLHLLKKFVRGYCPTSYRAIFRELKKDNYNYSLYTKHIKDESKELPDKIKFVDKDVFCGFLYKQLKDIEVDDRDKIEYEKMLGRIEARAFLPKQRDGDNRVIPQQLYRFELKAVLDRASGYTPLLRETENGISVAEKILSVFDFKVPYFVGPLSNKGENTWLVRKSEGRILPWNFNDKVDLDSCESAFIKRMTNHCTYYLGKDVLPENSLLYQSYIVLNELNNLKINGIKIPTEVKQELYKNVFETNIKVAPKMLKDYLVMHNYMERTDEISGLDETVKSSLRSYHIFKRLKESGTLNQSEVESIIEHMAYSEDKTRMNRWLAARYPSLSDEDRKYILKQKLKGFGRLSRELLNQLQGCEKESDGVVYTIIELLWNTNDNLMQLLSSKYSFADTLNEISRDYYADRKMSLDERLSDMYISNAVKRPIYRTLDIVGEVVKTMGEAPTKIFVEMSRGSDDKKERKKSRKEQLLELYKKIGTKESRELAESIESMGGSADNRLQDRNLFLYYLQMGKCAYSGKPMDLNRLSDSTYNIEHIYPQSFVKDDSILNNLVLVDSKLNEIKQDKYPVSQDIRENMRDFWLYLKNNKLMSDEKYRRLVRATPFTEEEKYGFINRQIVETQQSSKAVTELLKERFPDTEIVYVKAGIVSEFRQKYDMLKCRAVNSLHHAKDAYLNVVVGNVYHERFTKKWFSINEDYSVKIKSIFNNRLSHGEYCYWKGGEDIGLVRKVMEKNAVHMTKYAYCKKGVLFDQQPVRKDEGLVPLKKGLATNKYGGYKKPKVSFFVLARFTINNKRDIMFVPINIMDVDRFQSDSQYAKQYIASTIAEIINKIVENVELLFNGRKFKINTVIALDGVPFVLSCKSERGKKICLTPFFPLILGKEQENYVKAMSVFAKKRSVNKFIEPDQEHDGLSKEKNLALYDKLAQKFTERPFCKMPANQGELLLTKEAREKFMAAPIIAQIDCLLEIIAHMSGEKQTCNLEMIGGSKNAGKITRTSNLSSWTKNYTDVRILDYSAAGLSCVRSKENLLELL